MKPQVLVTVEFHIPIDFSVPLNVVNGDYLDLKSYLNRKIMRWLEDAENASQALAMQLGKEISWRLPGFDQE